MESLGDMDLDDQGRDIVRVAERDLVHWMWSRYSMRSGPRTVSGSRATISPVSF